MTTIPQDQSSRQSYCRHCGHNLDRHQVVEAIVTDATGRKKSGNTTCRGRRCRCDKALASELIRHWRHLREVRASIVAQLEAVMP